MISSNMLFHLIKHSKIIGHYPSKVIRNAVHVMSLSKQYSTQSPHAEELVIKEKIQIAKPIVTKWKRPPFAKNFFFGKFDTELLAFPEILDNELVTEVEKYVKYLNDLYIQKVNSRQIDETGVIPADLLQDLKDLGLFGRMMPAKYGGLDLSYTACTRLNEVIGLDWSIYSLLTAHEFLASRAILLFGTEQQKDKYLPLLATGRKIAAFCCAELESGCDLISIATNAYQNDDESFTISGVKCWVTNAEIADVFIVFAKTQNTVNPLQTDISVFIVDRDMDGIKITPHDKICLRGVKTSMVQLREVTVPKENLLGPLSGGCEMYFKILEGFRIAMSSFTFGTLKVLIDSVTDRIIHTERVERSLGDLQLVRQRLSRISSVIYAMESAAYFTAAILDSSEDPDMYMESAIMKIFTSEGTLYCLRELMELLGSTSLMKEQHLERFHRDAMGLLMFDGPNDFLRLYIGLNGLKVAGAEKAEMIMKARNRFFFPKDAFKQTVRRIRHFMNTVKYDQDIAGHIHPSLVVFGNLLEEKVQKFELAVEASLTYHGKNILETQIDPRKLADAAVYMYAEAAVLSRSSRSYCIGLRNHHHEALLGGTFCVDADQIIYRSLNDIFVGNFKNNEANHLTVGEQVIDCRGYFPEHPIKHNF